MSTKKTSAKSTQASPEEFSLISKKTLLALHRNLLMCRAKASPISRSRRAPKNAAEYDAVVVAVASCLGGDDHALSNVRSELIETLIGRPRTRSRKTKFTGQDLSGLLQVALGAALMNKAGKTGRIAVIFGGEGAGSAWSNALEAARANNLPIVFVSVVSFAKMRRNHAPVKSKLPPGTELPQIIVDGNDVVAVYRVAHEAVERARRDRGPTQIECAEYRVGGRVHDDPVANLEGYLKANGLLPLTSGRETSRPKPLRHNAN